MAPAPRLDRARLDHDFDLRARNPDFATDFALWEAESAAFRVAWPDWRPDLAYGDHPLERLDLFLPAAAGAPPVCLYFHPGSWQRLDKAMFSFVARPLLARGIAVAMVNYPLVPEVTIPGILDSLHRCLGHLRGQGAGWGIDPGRIGIMGHSAGGHLAAMFHARAGRLDPAIRAAIRVVAAVGGFYDLEPVRASFMNDALGLDPATAQAMSPILGEDRLDCPFVMAVGGEETAQFLTQQQEMAAALRAAGRQTQEIVLAGQGHFSLVAELARPGNPVMQAVAGHLDGGAPRPGHNIN